MAFGNVDFKQIRRSISAELPSPATVGERRMSAFEKLLTLVRDISPEDRQGLIISLVNLTGPAKFPLTSDFGASGTFSKVSRVLDEIPEPEHRTFQAVALVKFLTEEHCLWLLHPTAVQAA